MRAVFALAAGLAVWCSAGPARALPRRVALLEVEIAGDGAPELRPQLAASIAAGLKSAKVGVIKPQRVAAVFEESPELAGCLSSTCLERIGKKTGADGFIRARISADGDDYKIELELYDRSQLINKLELPCSVCTIGELNQAAKVTTAKLLTDASDRPIHVTIRTEPSGAKLTIDGIARGAAPFDGPLAPGSHVIVAEGDGDHRIERRVLVTEASATEPIVIEMSPGTSGDDPSAEPKVLDSGGSRLGTLKWVTAGAAVLALGTGATLVLLDGRGTCDGGNRECQRELNTGLAGVITAGGGVALGVAAAWMFWADRGTKEPNRRVDLAPLRGGAMALVSGRF